MHFFAILMLSVFLLNYGDGTLIRYCDQSRFHVECHNNATINIKSALYGRVSENVCTGGQKARRQNTVCRSPQALEVMKKACEGRTTCELIVNEKTFGNPCYKTSKYLELVYECLPPGLPPSPVNIQMLAIQEETANFIFHIPEEWQYPVSTYEVVLVDAKSKSQRISTTTTLEFKINNLMLNREYDIKVRAKTRMGHGNFSSSFRFKTLSSIESTLCASSWKSYGGSCFHYQSMKLNWQDSRGKCQEKGAELMSIWSSDHQSFIRSEFSNIKGDVYIGLNDINRPWRFEWTNGRKFGKYRSFIRNQRRRHNWDCVVIRIANNRMSGRYWQCIWKQPSLCEKKAEREHLYKPSIIKMDAAEANSTINFTCLAAAPTFVSQYTWLKNGRNIAVGKKFLKIVNNTDKGEYICEVMYNHNITISSDPVIVKFQNTGIVTTSAASTTTATISTTASTTASTTSKLTSTSTTSSKVSAQPIAPLRSKSSQGKKTEKHSNEVGIVVGTIGGVFGLLIIIIGLTCIVKRRHSMKGTDKAGKPSETTVAYNQYFNGGEERSSPNDLEPKSEIIQSS